VVTVNAGTVTLANIPGGSAATDVLVRTGAGDVEYRDASGLIGGYAWMLTGNSGTSPLVNFLGTTDGQPLVIRTNNVERVRVTATGEVGIGTSTPGALLHVAGDVQIDGNTTLGNAATDQVVVNAGDVELPNIPSGSTATEVLVWNAGDVERRSASGLIGGFAWMLAGNTLTGTEVLGSLNAQPLVVVTDGTERLRVTATGVVRIQNQDPTGATQVIIQAGANQAGVNLLEWQDNTGLPIGFIDNAGNVAIGDVNAPGFLGAGAYLHVYSNTAQPAAIFENGAVGIGTNAPAFGSTLHIYDARTAAGTGATKVIIQAGANQAGVNLLEWQDNTGLPIGFIDNAGNVAIGDVNAPGFLGAGAYLHVYSNTAQPAAIFQRGVVGIGTGTPAIGGPVLHVVGENPGPAARFEAGVVGSTPLELQGVPTAAAADEVLRIDPTTGEVTKSTAAAVVSAGIIKGSYTITSTGSSFNISVSGDIQPGAIVSVTLVRPSGGTIYPLMVTDVNDAAETITVESSGSIPGGVGYAIHYIIINP